MNILFTLLTSTSIMFLWLNHPLSMGCILICQTLIIAMITGMMISTFLFSYIIVIIMLSGALVLFIYMASVASNEKFQTPVKMITVMPVIIMISYLLSKDLTFLQGESDATISYNDTLSLIKLFNSLSVYITMMMIIYLLLAMIIVSNIASVTEGPLRTK
nr:NADH dehydrogenase subunit 6 [Aethus nigritus]UCC45906.1 NADH dehydrogenase subunit 6 [Aethus nigritus]